MTELSCQFDFKRDGQDKPLTVGDPFILSCDSTTPLALGEGLQFKFNDEKDKYTIHVLSTQEALPKNLKLLVASYRPGQYENKKLIITDGITELTTQELSWKVESVLKPNEQPQVYLSEGPFWLTYPLWFWIVMALIASAVFAAITGFVFYRKRQDKLKKEIQSYMTMLTPFNQFSRDMRQLRAKMYGAKSDSDIKEFIEAMHLEFRLYLLRELQLPAHQWSDQKIMKVVRARYKNLYELNKSHMRRTLFELSKAKHDSQNVKLKDCEDFLNLARSTAESIYDFKRKHKGALS